MRNERQFSECYGCNDSDGEADTGLSERDRAAVFTNAHANASRARTPSADCNCSMIP